MIKFKNLILAIFITFFTLSCQNDYNELMDDCFDCPSPETPILDTGGDPGPDPDPDPSPIGGTKSPQEIEYDKGYSIGKRDAKYIAEQIFFIYDCLVDKDELKEYFKSPQGYLNMSQLTYKKVASKCYYTTASQKAIFYQFVSDYLEFCATNIESNKGNLKEYYWRGIWEGFSYKNCELAFKYAYSSGCDLTYD